VSAITARQAATCESATSPAYRCRCRCGGALHGAARVTPDELEQLGEDDPHRVEGTAPSALELRRRAIAGDAPRDASDPWALQATARARADEAWGTPEIVHDIAGELLEEPPLFEVEP